jgi:hypothetical protein
MTGWLPNWPPLARPEATEIAGGLPLNTKRGNQVVAFVLN